MAHRSLRHFKSREYKLRRCFFARVRPTRERSAPRARNDLAASVAVCITIHPTERTRDHVHAAKRNWRNSGVATFGASSEAGPSRGRDLPERKVSGALTLQVQVVRECLL